MSTNYEKLEDNISDAYLLNRQKWAVTLENAKRNPALMIKAGLDYLSDETEGRLDFVDASNPATLLMEFSSTLAANNFRYFKAADKKHYPILATRMEDLYPHMSLTLYEGMYTVPTRAKFVLGYRVVDILKLAEKSDIDGIRKIMIPRGTLLQVDGTDFTTLHPIEIRVNDFDAIQVVYNTDRLDHLETINSNILNYWYRKDTAINPEDTHEEWLMIEVPVLQVTLTYHKFGLTHLAEPFNQIIPFAHKFVKARVYLVKEDGSETELKTTMSNLVYDPTTPTAVLSVLDDNNLRVHLPLIYYTSEQIKQAQVKVELYTSLGEVRINTEHLSQQNGVGVNYNSDDYTPKESFYVAPLEHMDTVCYAISDTAGGRDAVDFATMKRWVINAGRYEGETITHANLRVNGEILGYNIVTDVDHLTNRIFQATREIEPSPDGDFKRGVGCSIESVPFKMADLEKHDFVNSHGDRLTLLPDALFKTVGGVTTLLYDSEIPTLKSEGTIDSYIQRINTLEYIKTPFHYCFDASRTSFEVRPYYMMDPTYMSQSFIQSNNKTDLLMAVDKITVHYRDHGYTIRIVTRSNKELKQLDPENLFMQLAYIPPEQIDYAYLNGEWVGNEDKNPVFEFHIKTTFDFNSNHQLMLNNFNILTREKRVLPCQLKQDFRVIMGAYDYPKGVDDDIEINHRAGTFLLERDRTYTVIAENEIGIRFGDNLKNLWHNTRTTLSTIEFEEYEEDIPLTYNADVPVIDPATGLPKYTMQNGRMVFELAHQRGDTIYNSEGQPLLKHRKGDVKLDEKGEPVQKSPKQTLRIVDIFFYDGIYHFSNHEDDLAYIKTIPRLIVNWLETDIDRMKRNLLEHSELYFMPKRTMGYINIIAENGIERSIFNRLPFKVKYYLADKVWRNETLKESIRKMTYEVINEMLTNRTVSKDIIENTLRVRGGVENILGVNIMDMGLGGDVNTFTMVDEGSQCSVRRKISLTEDNHLRVREDIEIIFVNHDKRIGK